MRRSPTPFTRALALFLSCQPVLWMSNVAYAQTLEQGFEMQRQDPRNQQCPGPQGSQQQMQQLQMQQMGGQGAFGSFQQPGAGQQPGTGSIFDDAPGFGTPGPSPDQDALRLDAARRSRS